MPAASDPPRQRLVSQVGRFVSIVWVGAALSVTAAADTYPRQAGVDALHYRFDIRLTDDSHRLEAAADATFRILEPVGAIELDLISASGGHGMVVESVTTGGAPVPFTHAGNRLRLPVTAAPGSEVTYTINYGGVPAKGLQVFTNIHGDRVMFSEGWPDGSRHWLPMIDHPYDKATGEMVVTAPSRWQVVSNGVLVEEVDVSATARRTHWRQSVPLASWLFALGVARFDVHHAGMVQGVSLQTWSFPQDRVAARALFEETSRRAVDFFSSRVGPYPYERLANVQASGFAGGMENATVIFYGEKGVATGRGPVVHEIAHQWFGNSVTQRDWDDVWLSEGFATYFAMLYTEHFEGRDAFVDALRRSRASILAAETKLPDTPVVHRNLDTTARVLNRLVYDKGAWILHMLREEIGVEAFWAGIREYYRRYRDGNASSEDFRQVVEGVSGRDLRPFFAQWLHRAGTPKMEATWTFDETRKTVALTLRQTHGGEPFRIAVDVELVTATGRATARVSMGTSKTTVSVPVASEPTIIRLDPEARLLAEFAPPTRRPR